MNVCVYPNGDLASVAAAVLIAGQVIDKPKSVLGLATGSTPLPIYRELISMWHRGVIDFKNVVTYNLDEYVGLGPDHPCSYRRFMQENLFDHINVPQGNIHIPNGLAQDVDAECAAYDAAISAAGRLDLQLLGLGANGHIGFNEPAAVFTTHSYCVKLSEQTLKDNRRFFEDGAPMPTHALTMGIASIMQAKRIVLVATGKNKAAAVRAMIEGPVDPMVPASILQMHRHATILLDADAASLLSR
ncbi:MAG: glucosamine-6-phosphate deaminase [Candidatus Spyradocola sp.]|nr:glucosamine-6-phosphate deaminase [Candidatus Spyradocola sp.]